MIIIDVYHFILNIVLVHTKQSFIILISNKLYIDSDILTPLNIVTQYEDVVYMLVCSIEECCHGICSGATWFG